MEKFHTTLKNKIETMFEDINASNVTEYFKDFSPDQKKYKDIKVDELQNPVRKHEGGLSVHADTQDYVKQSWLDLINQEEYSNTLNNLVLGELLRFFRRKDESILYGRVSGALSNLITH